MKDWLLLLSLLLAVLITALGVVYTQFTSRQMFMEMQSLREQQDELFTQFGQLQLEQSTWSTHGRIEEVARDKLMMRIPRIGDVKMVYSAADEKF
jgi:cell division protein FtsL